MVINLNRFVNDKEIIAPIVDGWGKYEGRRLEFKIENGWYKIKIGNTSEIISKASPLEIYKTLKDKKHYLVFAYGEEGIPTNFDNFRRMGFEETVSVNFFNLPLYSVGKVTKMEDGRFYFFELESRIYAEIFKGLRGCINGKSGDISSVRGLTPELFYYSILIQLSSEAFHEVDRLDKLVLSPEEKEKRVKEFANTVEDRLKKIVQDSGGKLIEFKKSRGDSILVTWEVGGQRVKSTIKGDTFSIVSAGYCLSGEDKKHTMNSIVRLAKEFQKDKPLYITRE